MGPRLGSTGGFGAGGFLGSGAEDGCVVGGGT